MFVKNMFLKKYTALKSKIYGLGPNIYGLGVIYTPFIIIYVLYELHKSSYKLTIYGLLSVKYMVLSLFYAS